MALLVIAYPTMDARHLAWIQAVRPHYPELHWSVLAPISPWCFPSGAGRRPPEVGTRNAQVGIKKIRAAFRIPRSAFGQARRALRRAHQPLAQRRQQSPYVCLPKVYLQTLKKMST
jgi:hypothetical protein